MSDFCCEFFVVCWMLLFNKYWYYDVEYIIVVDDYSFCIFYEVLNVGFLYILVYNDWLVFFFQVFFFKIFVENFNYVKYVLY